MLRMIGRASSWVCVHAVTLPLRAFSLTTDRIWLLPISILLFLVLSPLFIVGWAAYVVAGIAAVGEGALAKKTWPNGNQP